MKASARDPILTGQHTVRPVEGGVLRFFLADGPLSDTRTQWAPVTDVEFQHAYELAQFDPAGLKAGTLRANPHRMQLALDALIGTGGFFWSDGFQMAGVMTANGKAPQDCGLELATLGVTPGGAP